MHGCFAKQGMTTRTTGCALRQFVRLDSDSKTQRQHVAMVLVMGGGGGGDEHVVLMGGGGTRGRSALQRGTSLRLGTGGHWRVNTARTVSRTTAKPSLLSGN